MALLKTIIRLVILILLCIPIVYFQYYIIKDTARSIMVHDNKNKRNVSKDKREEYLREAK